ncbi:MAG: response regulator transcription factor [Trebonia sp.]
MSADLVLEVSRDDETVIGQKGPLAPREIETAVLLAQGLTYRQVARRMHLTESTVTTYAKRARAKLDVVNKAELTKKIIELGYLRV